MHCDLSLISLCKISAMQVLFEFYFGISSLRLCILLHLGEHKIITKDFPVQGRGGNLSLNDLISQECLFPKAAKVPNGSSLMPKLQNLKPQQVGLATDYLHALIQFSLICRWRGILCPIFRWEWMNIPHTEVTNLYCTVLLWLKCENTLLCKRKSSNTNTPAAQVFKEIGVGSSI